jgi:hypothetical protein
MSLELARTVADAVLYEGYLLYPYRASSSKNQVRWQFGVLGPPTAAGDGVGEEPSMHTECLVRVEAGAEVTVHLRFLQLQARGVERADPDGFTPVGALRLGAVDLLSWDEAVDRSLEIGPLRLSTLAGGWERPIAIPGGEEIELVTAPDGVVVARVVRRRWPLAGRIRLATSVIAGHDGVVRLAVDVDNTSARPPADRTGATRVSFLGAHLLLQVTGADFISLLEPPGDLIGAAAACRQRRCWPVLIGVEGQTDIVLASPIILYDYPAVAPESAGALFDSTEIDEILTLRVMTLTDDEKAAARATDPAAAAIIDRCEQMSPEAMQQLHGVLRDPHAPLGAAIDQIPTFSTPDDGSPLPAPGTRWWDRGVDGAVSPTTDVVMIDDVAVAKGSRVRLHPRRHADAQDIFFADRVATVTAVYFDVDGQTHVAVVLLDDPAADLHEWYGRYLYFSPEEIQPLDAPTVSPSTVAGRDPTTDGLTTTNKEMAP